tara:strand:+ start:140 stop:274 length:135 start_codon:yes stop_codon:yes gene_type:complete
MKQLHLIQVYHQDECSRYSVSNIFVIIHLDAALLTANRGEMMEI